MTLEEAKALLSTAVKSELRDHAFGDCEVLWYKDGTEIASGYFGGSEALVAIEIKHEGRGAFKGDDAHQLRKCFASEQVDRNDVTGPDEFELGQVMPGLTKEGVFKEITNLSGPVLPHSG